VNSRDIWSHGGRRSDLKDLLSSSFAMLLLAEECKDPIYLASPWITDFYLFENSFKQFSALFPEIGEKSRILFSDYLVRLGESRKVRIITRKDKFSEDFLAQKKLEGSALIDVRFSDDVFHEKGILTPFFYIFGSMNLTYSGLTINGEKITYYSAESSEGKSKISHTYVEFNNLWESLAKE